MANEPAQPMWSPSGPVPAPPTNQAPGGLQWQAVPADPSWSSPPAGQHSWQGPQPQDMWQQPPPDFMSYGLAPHMDAMKVALRKRAIRQIVIGAVLFLIGAGITVATYESASTGGSYLLMWGPMIFGVVRMVKGLINFVQNS